MSDKPIGSSTALLEEPAIQKILASDSAFEILLFRLKQSIKACDEFGSFIRKKHSNEQTHSRDVRKTASTARNSIKSSCVTAKGSFPETLREVIAYDEKLVAEVRQPYITMLDTMYVELGSLSQNFTRLRKQVKEEGARKEKEVLDAISQAAKSQSKYVSICADLDRLRNSDQSQRSKITLQGRKTNSQQEEELTRKLHSADADYNKKAHYSQKLKNELIDTHRPRIAAQMRDLILELDNALQLQLSKYALYNESLVIGMGNEVTPLSSAGHISMQQTASSVDVERNLYGYLRNSRIQRKTGFVPVEYKRHKVFGGLTPDGSYSKTTPQITVLSNNQPRVVSGSSVTSTPNLTSFSSSLSPAVNHMRSQSSVNSSGLTGPRPMMQSLPGLTPALSPSKSSFASSAPPVPVGGAVPAGSPVPAAAIIPPIPSDAASTSSASPGNLFGLPIEEVPHDEEIVPLFVKKCITLLEMYGADSEGIYRSSPNKAKFEQLKKVVDTDPSNLDVLDPPTPGNVSNDYIFVIASLHKKFFASLPEPLLTFEQSGNFMKAGQMEDVKMMRLQLHRIVFELPDANYFTLRDLLFHFINLSKMPKVRMNVHNLSIVWSNNLFAEGSATTPGDLQLQQRVVEELINAAPDMFDPVEEDEA